MILLFVGSVVPDAPRGSGEIAYGHKIAEYLTAVKSGASRTTLPTTEDNFGAECVGRFEAAGCRPYKGEKF